MSRRFAPWLVFGLFALLFGFLTYANLYWRGCHVDNDDTYETLLVARSLLHGEGNVAPALDLDTLDYLRQHGRSKPPWPNMERPLALVLPVALLEGLVGARLAAVQVFSLLSFLGSLVLVFLIGRSAAGTGAGLLGTAALLVNRDTWGLALSGMSECYQAFLTLAAVSLALCVRNPWGWAGAGAVSMAMVTLRPSLVPIVPLVGWLAWAQVGNGSSEPIHGRRRAIWWFLAAVVLVGLGYLVANRLTTGFWVADARGGSGMREGTRLTYPGLDGCYPDYLPPLAVLKVCAGDVAKRTVANLLDAVGSIHDMIGAAWVLPAFLLAFALRSNRTAWRLALVSGGVFAVMVLSSAMTFAQARYLVPFGGLMFAVAATAVAQIIEFSPAGLRRGMWVAVAAAVLLCSTGWIVALPVRGAGPYVPGEEIGYLEVAPDNQREIERLVPEGAVVMSNVAATVAWHSGRPAIMPLPQVKDIPSFEERFGFRIEAIYLTPNKVQSWMPPTWSEWENLRAARTPPPGYEVASVFENGSVLFVKAEHGGKLREG